MSDLRELYQEVIVEHSRHPRNFREIGGGRQAEGYNPLCGDKVRVFLMLDDGTITDLSFQGSGCAISTASASMMTELLKGRKAGDVELIFEDFQGLVTGVAEPDMDAHGKLAVFAGVRTFPTRVKCATLAWHTLRAALEERGEPVTTEQVKP